MIVYVVTNYFENDAIEGIFSTPEKARAFVAVSEDRLFCYITTFTLDSKEVT